MVKKYTQIWKKIFDLSNKMDMDKPLTKKILSDPQHEFVKKLIRIYTMDCFVFKQMNKAAREQNKAGLRRYGPFATALSFIVQNGLNGTDNINSDNKSFTVYRGLRVFEAELQ